MEASLGYPLGASMTCNCLPKIKTQIPIIGFIHTGSKTLCLKTRCYALSGENVQHATVYNVPFLDSEGLPMTNTSFQQEIDARIAKYDLLCHPFYQAWSMGTLKQEEIREYACDYYHHVAAFPEYLSQFQRRLPAGAVRELVEENRADEEGIKAADRRTHAEVWLDFAQGMGADRQDAVKHEPILEIKELIAKFTDVASTGTTAEALAAFYAYESQVPRVATEKERGLLELYGADKKTAYYFALHKTFDVLHSRSWLDQLTSEIETNPGAKEAALSSAESVAKALWNALDGVERERLAASRN
jgi:pyrroloquinoline-quinone synthase